ncbi:ATP-grasp domain-containing protein [Streptomyces sp. NPDC059063]|uniref:ATP-grasp domain-containing protein n=1 Tax=unclassified Streptomyces TaxID=2593676 RepID=UPI0036800D5D
MRIAIVDGFSSGRHLTRELHQRGAECFHIRSRPRLPRTMTASFEPRLYEQDFGYIDDFARLVLTLRALRVRQVVAGAETGVLLAENLAQALGLPGNPPLSSALRRSKPLMSAALRRAGLAAVADTVVESPGEAVRWCAGQGLTDVVVKPVDSSASDNVWFCRGAAEIADACHTVLTSPNFFGDANRRALVQERLTGREFYVNTLSEHGHHTVTESWQYTKRTVDGRFPVYDYEEPSDPAAPDTGVLHAYVRAALTALGVRHGAAHSEVMVTARGPVLIEAGARLGGGVLPQVTARHTGASHAGLLADLLLGAGTPVGAEPTLRWPGRVRYVSLINQAAGVVRSADWERLVASLPTVDTLMPLVRPGARLRPTTDLATSPGFVYLTGPDQAALERDYAILRTWEAAGLYTELLSPTAVSALRPAPLTHGLAKAS